MPRNPAPLSILYQDDWLIAVDKPAGQLVIPSDAPKPEDEVTMKILRDQIGQKLHPLHRLDRPTSGVLLFASDEKIARELHRTFETHQIKKRYWAVVIGHPVDTQFSCLEPLRKTVDSPAKPAETSFCLVEHLPESLSLLEATPRTGRFHQIRRHLAHLGHPIVGDYRYAGIERSNHLGAILGTGTRMLLQAISLEFVHPASKQEVKIESPLDPLIANLRPCHNP